MFVNSKRIKKDYPSIGLYTSKWEKKAMAQMGWAAMIEQS